MVSPMTSRVLVGCGPNFERARLHEGRGDAEAGQRVRQQVDRAAIERSRRHDMVAGIHQRRNAEVKRRHTARGAYCADAVLQRRQTLLQNGDRRIGDAGIEMSGTFQVEQRSRMVGILEDVGGGLIDRHRARAGRGIGMLAGMQAQGFEGGRLGCWHIGSRGGARGVPRGFATMGRNVPRRNPNPARPIRPAKAICAARQMLAERGAPRLRHLVTTRSRVRTRPDVPQDRSHHALRRPASAGLDRDGNGRGDASHLLFANPQLQPRFFARHHRHARPADRTGRTHPRPCRRAALGHARGGGAVQGYCAGRRHPAQRSLSWR